jgi:hypothetical protein
MVFLWSRVSVVRVVLSTVCTLPVEYSISTGRVQYLYRYSYSIPVGVQVPVPVVQSTKYKCSTLYRYMVQVYSKSTNSGTDEYRNVPFVEFSYQYTSSREYRYILYVQVLEIGYETLTRVVRTVEDLQDVARVIIK